MTTAAKVTMAKMAFSANQGKRGRYPLNENIHPVPSLKRVASPFFKGLVWHNSLQFG